MIRRLGMVAVLLGGGASALTAQSGLQGRLMGGATVVGMRADPTPYGGPLSEIRIVSPVVLGDVRYGRLQGQGSVSLERWTIPGGVLTPGAWGEGFVDRRHPHTTVHELLVGGTDLLGPLDGAGRLGLVAGKGFVPFGTDDPMSRPFVSFPVNHHLAQILERAVAIVQYQAGPVTLEGALFNGDEPERPDQWPLLRRADGAWRFGDSRAGRVTIAPVGGLEVEGSLARVFSPEHRPGGGGYALKSSAAVRWEDAPASGRRYAMAEWARTSEFGGVFVFRSVLVEGEMQRGPLHVAYRFETTERPEEERIDGRFRSLRPHHENSIQGIGRWTLHTMRAAVDLPGTGALGIRPFVEATVGRVRGTLVGAVDVEFIYGGGAIRQFNLGVTMDLGMRNHRMGRYGLLAHPVTPATHHHESM